MTEPIVTASGLVKTFGRVVGLDNCDFALYPGEVLAVIGDNGAGKSTLIKCISGAEVPDTGTITLEGKEINFKRPQDARAEGIETVYQDLALCPHLDAVQNLFLGREVKRRGLLGALGFMNRKEMRQVSVDAFTDLGATVRTLTEPVGAMSGGQKQGIAVARSATWANRIVFLDEPTAALGVVQTANVLDLIRRVRDKGIGVVLISHSMPEVLEVADTVQVLRRGKRVATYRAADTSIEELVGAMTGKLEQEGAA